MRKKCSVMLQERVMMDKRRPKLFSVASIIFCVVLLAVGFCALNCALSLRIREDHSVASYFNEQYSEYNGGASAKAFFDEFANTEGYQDIAFHYIDAEKIISLHKYYTVFVLDVYYTSDGFSRVYHAIADQRIASGGYGAFDIYFMDTDDEIYRNNNAYVMFDAQHNTIRYVFICNCSDNVHPETVLSWSLDIGWNDSEKDLIFDYSDLPS